MYLNHMTGAPLHRDGRGRVRFSFATTRYEVTKTGVINAYDRSPVFGEGIMNLRNAIGAYELGSPDFLRTLADAIEFQKDELTRPASNMSYEIAGMA
jgi:hypothetical protein